MFEKNKKNKNSTNFCEYGIGRIFEESASLLFMLKYLCCKNLTNN